MYDVLCLLAIERTEARPLYFSLNFEALMGQSLTLGPIISNLYNLRWQGLNISFFWVLLSEVESNNSF